VWLLYFNLNLSSDKLSHFSDIWQTFKVIRIFPFEPKERGGGGRVGLFYCINTLWSSYSVNTSMSWFSLSLSMAYFSMTDPVCFTALFVFFLPLKIGKVTINVPVVYMSRDIIILMGENPCRGPTPSKGPPPPLLPHRDKVNSLRPAIATPSLPHRDKMNSLLPGRGGRVGMGALLPPLPLPRALYAEQV
jgi:hypothetical protein